MDETFLSISFKVYHMHTLRQENGEKIKVVDFNPIVRVTLARRGWSWLDTLAGR